MFKKKWFWIVVILLSAGMWWYSRRDTGQEQYVTAAVTRGDIAQTVSVSATLVADEEIDLEFETSGRIRQVDAEVGEEVSQGDTLATLESASLNKELEKAEADLAKAKADAGKNDDALREAREEVDNAEDELEKTEDAEDQKVDAADKAFENAEDYEDAAEAYYNQVVAENGADSSEAKSAQLTLTAATNSRKAAEEAKETARKNRDVEIGREKSELSRAKEDVKTLESKYREIIETNDIRIAQANYEIALNNLEKAQIKAPVNGTVTKVNFEKGEVIGSGTTEPFGKLLSADWLLEADVPESDIAKIKLRQEARVTFDALNSDEIFEATVVEIDPESTVIQDVVYYKVKLRLVVIDPRLKPGMSADADVLTAEKKNTLILPSRAVKQEGGRRFVEVVGADGKTLERREVKIGLEGDEGQVEIVSGVREGENVVERK
jgi:RND family efflux transporter MFP subunit